MQTILDTYEVFCFPVSYGMLVDVIWKIPIRKVNYAVSEMDTLEFDAGHNIGSSRLSSIGGGAVADDTQEICSLDILAPSCYFLDCFST